jgi:hypothetical protein
VTSRTIPLLKVDGQLRWAVQSRVYVIGHPEHHARWFNLATIAGELQFKVPGADWAPVQSG